MTSWTHRSGNRAEGLFHRPAAPLLLALAGPVVFVGLLLLIPTVRGLFSANPYLITTVTVAVMIAAVVVAFRSMGRRSNQLDNALETARGEWATARGWKYTPGERLIESDALSEVDSRLRPEPVPVKFEASGTFHGRRAFLHSRDAWVRIRSSVGKARREVVGVESPIVLPKVVVEAASTGRRALVITSRAERNAHRRAEGLVSVSGPQGTGTVLWTPPDLESHLPTVLGPALQSIPYVFGTERVIIACQGQWVLVSVPDGPVGDLIDERLTYAAQLADALERGAAPAS